MIDPTAKPAQRRRRRSARIYTDLDGGTDLLGILRQIWRAPHVGGSIGERHIAISDELWERIRQALDDKDCP